MNTTRMTRKPALASFASFAVLAAVSLVLVGATGCMKKHKPASSTPTATVKCQIDMDCPLGGACQIRPGEPEGICVRAGENSPNAAPSQGPGQPPGQGPRPAPMPSVTASPNDIQL
ncbi:hypothetical protein AKJ09_02443 [Labilithrix luteola]|uniref:Lipoprotein n=1 Tax=Labilithrix luteola TaxID=1391654 RepID=A0A0K1PRP1_9BACT|nr:hypothetical protein [Labilithrix luteola]AKU95779.1 hypothetical protein AKJ09_02443 [Labilithrix luteola]